MSRPSESVGEGADFLQLTAAHAPARGVTTWLTGELRSAIGDGRLHPGARLPATRVLAVDLGVARGVVVEAYQRLGDEGLVTGRVGVGTVVVPLRTATGPPTVPGAGSGRAAVLDEVPRELPGPFRLPLPVAEHPEPAEVDLSPGLPDLAAFPRAAWLRAERTVLAQLSAVDLGYGDPQGSPRLRAELSGWLARTRGVRAEPGAIVVVAGVAQSLALLAQTLLRRGTTTIAVEDPGSRGASQELAHWGLEPVPVPVDGSGLQVEALVRSGLRVALLTPAHQFPTGVVLDPLRRRALLAWARDGGLVVEDDYDAEHRYDRTPVPALQASAPEHVAHTGSTSKTLAPGLRLGWLVAPAHLHADLVAAKHASDLGSPALPQLVLAQLLASGEYDRHLRLVRTRQRRRRDAMLSALRQYLPAAHVQGVAAGLHLLITFPDLTGRVDDVELAATARDAGLLVHPLSWHRQRPGPPGLVLGYAAHPPDRLQDAIRRLAALVPAAGTRR